MDMVTLMIVDDEAKARRGLRYCVDWKEMGIEVCAESANGAQAYELALELHPDIVITDIRMPFMDGITLCAKLYESSLNSRVVFITGYEEVSYLRSAIRYGASEYLLKPVDVDMLKDLMRRMVTEIKKEKDHNKETEYMRRTLESMGKYIPEEDEEQATSFREERLRKMEIYIDGHIGEKLTVQDIAIALGYSASYIAELFKREKGITINEFVTARRMEQAKKLLDHSMLRIYEVAEKVGYKDVKYFSQLFRKHFGELPKERRKK